MYSYGYGISSVILLSIQNIYDRHSVTHDKNQNANTNFFDIHVKNSNVGLEIHKTCFTANVS
jgi:hypothetical protein